MPLRNHSAWLQHWLNETDGESGPEKCVLWQMQIFVRKHWYLQCFLPKPGFWEGGYHIYIYIYVGKARNKVVFRQNPPHPPPCGTSRDHFPAPRGAGAGCRRPPAALRGPESAPRGQRGRRPGARGRGAAGPAGRWGGVKWVGGRRVGGGRGWFFGGGLERFGSKDPKEHGRYP